MKVRQANYTIEHYIFMTYLAKTSIILGNEYKYMDMKLNCPPQSLENRSVRKHELDKYFINTSLEHLVRVLAHMRRIGCLDYEITLDKAYVEMLKNRDAVLTRSDVLVNAPKPLGDYVNDEYGLGSLHRKISSSEPLSDSDVMLISSKLPSEMKENMLSFKLTNIDWEALEELISDYPANSTEEDALDKVEYNGLVVDGAVVSYKGKIINVGYQHRQVIRMLVEQQGGICTKDDFMDDYVGIFNRDNYANVEITLRKLISAVRNDLKTATGKDCITNIPSEGWRLSL